MVLVLVSGLVSACAESPPVIPPLDPEAATDLVRAEFPEAGVVVRGVEAEGARATGTTDFTLGESEVVLVFGHDREWALTHVVLDGEQVTVADLRAMVATQNSLVTLYDGLVRYHGDRGEYPEGEDAAGLGALMPDYAPEELGFEDGWGNPFAYRPQDGEFTLSSAGIDGTMGSPDDLILLSTGVSREPS